MAPRRRRSKLFVPMAAALALIAGACGSDTPATTAATTAAGNDVEAVAATSAATAAPTQPAGAAPTPATEPGAGATASTTVGGGGEAASTPAPEALQFQAPLLGGGTFDGAAYGERPVVFWFWAPT